MPFLLTVAHLHQLGHAVARGLIQLVRGRRAVGWGIIAFLTAYNLLPSYLPFLFAPPKERQYDEPMSPSRKLMACWGGSLGVPPRPIPELPDSLEDVEEPWMVEAKLPSRWSNSERKVPETLSRPYSTEFAAVTPYADVYGDRRLLRVLRMDPDRDEDLAVKKVGEYLTWAERHERG